MTALSIDRDSPRRRPGGAPSGTQRWRELLFVHWSYPLEAVRPLVPPALELDAWEGRAWIGLVPFRMLDVRPAFLPRAIGLDFLETNVRTYVHHDGCPGVYFFSLEASSRLAVWAARHGWGLPYYHATMRSTTEAGLTTYEARRSGSGATLRASFRLAETLGSSPPGSRDAFLLERYLLFMEHRGRLRCGQVHHPPYVRRGVELVTVEEQLLAAAGLPPHPRAPQTVHYSDGVDVDVFGPWIL